ncbi:VCBS repeat-containing protein [Actinoplanes sp. NPDC051861]|uniref:FG-GAP repeat domain-containing protein n=1 Tax=Actinoplanes sp. NPDC051861 TaxID=3155170 RepID=UPI0034170F90
MRLRTLLASAVLATTAAIGGLTTPAYAATFAPCVAGGPTAADASLASSLNPTLTAKMRNHLNDYRISCARRVVETVQIRGLDKRAAVIAVTTTIVETSIQNYSSMEDHDSLGLFQQRASWGSAADRIDPPWATNKFLDKMLALYPNNAWMQGSIGPICQAVQVSAYPDRYQVEAADAQRIVDALWGSGRRAPDLNGDGYSDLWALNTSDIQLVYPNKADGSGTFWSSRERGNAGFRLADLGDVDGNGSADLYAVTNDHDQLWYPNRGGNGMEFWSARDNGPAPGFRLMSLGDLNADGFADIVAVYQTNELVLYMNRADGSGTFWSAKKIGIAPGFRMMDLGDLTGDGYADLYAVTNDGQQLSYVNRGGDGNDVDRFWSGRELGYANFRAAQLGNLDGDKYADLYGITGDGTNQQIVYMNRATKGTDTARFWSGNAIGAAPGIKIPSL